MNKLVPLLEKLAQELGTTAGHLWEVLIAQSKIAFVCYTIEFFICFSFLFVAVFLFIRSFRPIQAKVYNHYKEKEELQQFDNRWNYWSAKSEDMTVARGIMFGIFGLVAVIWSACYIASLSTVIASLLNPEYWALQKVLSFISQ